MATPSLGTATLRTSLDRSGLTTGLNAAKSDTERTLSTLDRRFEQTGKKMTSIGKGLSLGLTAPIVAATGAAIAGAVQLGKYADQLLDLEQQTGLSTTRLQEFENVARAAGVETSVLSGAAEGLTRRLRAGGDESKTFTDSLDAIGVSTRDASGGMRDMDDLMPEIIGRLGEIDNITERNAISMQLLGRRATELAPVLALGSDEIARLSQEAHDMGQVLDREALNAANDFRIEWEQTRAELGLAGREIQQSLVPAMTGFVGVMRTDVVPVIRAGAENVARFLEWWNGLDDSTKRLFATLTGTAAATGPILTFTGTMVTQLPKMAAGFTLVRTSLAPLAGPAGILAGAALGYIALNDAMNAGEDTRRRAQDSFDSLIGRMQSYRSELSITSEAERTAAQEALERQRRVLEVTLQNQEAFVRSVEADVVAFANKGFFGQLFGFGEANVNLNTLDQAEGQLATLRRELAAIDTQLEEVASFEIPTRGGAAPGGGGGAAGGLGGGGGAGAVAGAVEAPLGSLRALQEELQAEREQFELAATDAVREQSAERIRMLEAEVEEMRSILRDGPLAEPITIRARVEFDDRTGLRAAERALDEERAATDAAARQRVGTVQTFNQTGALGSGIVAAERELSAERNAVAVATRDLDAAYQASTQTLGGQGLIAAERALNEEREAQRAARQAELAEATAAYRTGTQTFGGAGLLVAERELAAEREEQVAAIRTHDAAYQALTQTFDGMGLVAAERDLGRERDEQAAAIAEHAAALQAHTAAYRASTQTFEGMGIVAADRTFAREPRLTNEQAAFGAGAGDLSRDLSRRAQRGDGGLNEADRIIKDAAREHERTANLFAASAVTFTSTLVDSIQSGDIGQAFEGLLSTGGNLATSLIGGWEGILIGGAIGILGSLFGGAFGGGNRQELERAEQARIRSAPSLVFNVNIRQDWEVIGGPASPESRQMVNQAARATVDEIFSRTRILERVGALEGGSA